MSLSILSDFINILTRESLFTSNTVKLFLCTCLDIRIVGHAKKKCL
jgi:hypothetical protein